jgi:hypothetical protein
MQLHLKCESDARQLRRSPRSGGSYVLALHPILPFSLANALVALLMGSASGEAIGIRAALAATSEYPKLQ